MSYPSLNFALGETIDMLRDQVQSFVAKEIAPRAAQIDIDNLFPADLWRKFGDMGLLGITCLLYTSPSPRDLSTSRMPSSA